MGIDGDNTLDLMPRGMLLSMTPNDLTDLFGLNEDDVDVIFMAKEQIELGTSPS